jgi:hypothetical protein
MAALNLSESREQTTPPAQKKESWIAESFLALILIVNLTHDWVHGRIVQK